MVRERLRLPLYAMNETRRIDSLLSQAAAALTGVSESPRLDAELLMSQALDVARSYLFAHPEDTLDALSAARFSALLERRQRGEPLAYLQGVKEFWSMPLMVSPDTLVPRPETEILVDQALAVIPGRGPCDVLDLGTGSGAVALAIARERPSCRVTATDASAAALAIARENARQLDIANVEFALGSWLSAVPGRCFDVIVSNPPYIRSGDPALEALTFEPALALVAGVDGLAAIRRIAAEARSAVREAGHLLLEHGADQAPAVAAILESAGWTDLLNARDYAGLPRVTTGRAPAV